MQSKTQIAKEYLIEIITSSPVGARLPSERELVSHLGFSRPIIQNAVNSLLAEGYIYKVDRQGAFIAKNTHINSLNRLKTFNEVAQESNTVASTMLIDRSILNATDVLASDFNCKEGEKIHYYLRLRKIANRPVELDFSYYMDFAVSKITDRYLLTSIHKYVEDVMRLPIASSSSTIDAVIPEPEIASHLDISSEDPLLQLNTYSRLVDGRIFEHTISYIVSRYYKLSVTSVR